MDNIWIFLVIIGAVFSFAQKNQSKRQAKSDNSTDEEHNDERPLTPHEMLERRVREMLGEEAPKRTSSPTVMPTPHPTKAKPATKSSRTTTAQQRPAVTTSNAKTAQPSATATKNQPQNGQNSKILEEFTMEKAVIYSEILKPKFEEY